MISLDETCLRARGHKKKDIARLSGLTPKTIGAILSGKVDPKSTSIDRINAAIDVLEGKENA